MCRAAIKIGLVIGWLQSCNPARNSNSVGPTPSSHPVPAAPESKSPTSPSAGGSRPEKQAPTVRPVADKSSEPSSIGAETPAKVTPYYDRPEVDPYNEPPDELLCAEAAPYWRWDHDRCRRTSLREYCELDTLPPAEQDTLDLLRAEFNAKASCEELATHYGALLKLDLRNRALISVYPLVGMQALQELILSNNTIGDLSPLSELRQLVRVVLDDNRVERVDTVAHWPRLQVLSLRHNRKLRSLSFLAHVPATLEYLDISETTQNDITHVSRLAALLVLSVAKLSLVDLNWLYSLRRLRYLNASGNMIVDALPLACLTELGELDLSSNRLTQFPTVQNLRDAEYPVTRDSTPCSLPGVNGSWPMWRLLTKLNVADNKLRSVEGLELAPSLKELELGGNNLRDIEPLSPIFPGLVWLGLSRNPSLRLLSGLGALSQLAELDLSGCHLSSFDELRQLPPGRPDKLRKLVLTGCEKLGDQQVSSILGLLRRNFIDVVQ